MSRISSYDITEKDKVLSALSEIVNRDVALLIKDYSDVFFDFDLLRELLFSSESLEEGDDNGVSMNQYSLLDRLVFRYREINFYTLRCPELGELIKDATNDGKTTLKIRYDQDTPSQREWYYGLATELRGMMMTYNMASEEIKTIVLKMSMGRGRINVESSIKLKLTSDKGCFVLEDFITPIDELAELEKDCCRSEELLQHFQLNEESTQFYNNTLYLEIA